MLLRLSVDSERCLCSVGLGRGGARRPSRIVPLAESPAHRATGRADGSSSAPICGWTSISPGGGSPGSLKERHLARVIRGATGDPVGLLRARLPPAAAKNTPARQRRRAGQWT